MQGESDLVYPVEDLLKPGSVGGNSSRDRLSRQGDGCSGVLGWRWKLETRNPSLPEVNGAKKLINRENTKYDGMSSVMTVSYILYIGAGPVGTLLSLNW